MIAKTIQIEGYLLEKEISKGKTAIWNGSSIEEVLNYDVDNYIFTDPEIDSELLKAQKFANEEVAENGWVIEPIAKITIHKL